MKITCSFLLRSLKEDVYILYTLKPDDRLFVKYLQLSNKFNSDPRFSWRIWNMNQKISPSIAKILINSL